jgi:hypothetical protein
MVKAVDLENGVSIDHDLLQGIGQSVGGWWRDLCPALALYLLGGLGVMAHAGEERELGKYGRQRR